MFPSTTGLGLPQTKRRTWTWGVSSFVVFLLFLLWIFFLDLPEIRANRAKYNLTQTHRQTATGRNRTRRSTFYDAWTYTREAEQLMCGPLPPPLGFPYFCYNPNQTLDVLIIAPRDSFRHNHWGTASKWRGYHWYIRGLLGDGGWGSIFRSTAESSWKKGSYGWTPRAREWSRIISNFTVSDSFFTFRVNTTGQPFPVSTQGYITFCSRLLICAGANGKDPCWQIMFCPDFNATTTTLLRTGLGFSPVKQVKIIEGTPSTDNWFQIVTGISGEANNWLLMVEQAANVIKEDCVVCMGPRPLLRVVPAAVPAECVADLMTNTIPFSPDCRKLDRFYPLAPSDKTLTGVPPPLTHQPTWRRSKRDTGWMGQNDPTYIDSLGVPRGVPDEYKLVNQVASGFESILLWITPNKNVDRINYIHYNVQKLANYTVAGFEAVHEQLKATSLMAFQNRIALDMLLAEKSGVCGIFGDQCCTFNPNNTQAGGKLTVAIDGMRTLNKKMKDHSGVDTSMWDDWMKVFGPWKNLISSILVAVAVFTAILTLCGCCCIPCIRSLLTRLIEKAVGDKDREHGQYAMLPVSDPFPPPQLSNQFV
uniref:Uncharacterized protein n=1 Tax=Oryzias latipes TaxID=8090 RepID=A0A3B3I1W1_ORYLA